MNFELTASMMCADFGHLADEVKALDEGGIDSFHIDIMDGRYVANYAMSLNDMKCIRELTDKPLDVHLMVEHPNTHINLFLQNLKKQDQDVCAQGRGWLRARDDAVVWKRCALRRDA